ncbi:MAG: TonB-dependent receptor plug domain-containing protein, partial [Flavisolibacter sp.]
ASTNFQDLAYNIYLPTKRSGTFTFFGFGGLSSQQSKAIIDSTKWHDKDNRYQAGYTSNTAATGITHQYFLGNKTNLRSAIAFSYNRIGEDVQYVEDDYQLTDEYRDNYKTRKWTLSSTLNHKYSTRSSLRAGAIVNLIGLNYFKRERENEHEPMKDVINSKNQTQTVQAFAQWQFKPVEKFTFNIGLHSLYLNYNQTKSIEPRASVKWQANGSNAFAFGYGGHSQMQALGVYFAQHMNSAGNIEYPNRNLEFTKAHHYVLSYQHAFNKTLSLKTELYYQQLYNVPVGNHDSSTFSVLNIEKEFVTDPLVNKGKGRNYGVEISIEKYLSDYFYYTLSTSIYQSKYSALDGIERNTRFNGNFIANMVAGKEFLSSNKLKTYGINIKTIYAGGLRTTPVDVTRSQQEGKTVFMESEAYSLQNPNYFRSDLRLSIKWNRTKRLTSSLSLDIQNISNRLNVLGQWYDTDKSAIVTEYQNGLIPVLNYKVEF